MPDNKDYGVITEQGYNTGCFGFKPITEDEKSKVEAELEKKNKKDD